MIDKCATCNIPDSIKEQNGSIRVGSGLCSICYKLRGEDK